MERKEEKPNSEKPHYFLDSEEEKEVEEVDNKYTLCSLREKRLNHVVHVLVNKERLKIGVDTDGAMSVIGEYTYKTLKKKHRRVELKETRRDSTHIPGSK